MKAKSSESVIRLSVRELVEWVLRDGDIDRRSAGVSEENAMLLGAAIHKKLQRESAGSYTAEVPLSFDFILSTDKEGEAPVTLSVSGRADGVIREKSDGKESVTVDEIKGVFRDVEAMKEPEKVHLAQAELYAFMIAEAEDLDEISVQMTYVQLETEEEKERRPFRPETIRRFHSQYKREEIVGIVRGYAELYRRWAFFTLRHRADRNASADGFPFPYPFRPGQKTMVSNVYRAIEEEKNLFLQAPTGIGKTLGVLYPAVRAVGNGFAEKIFYLTAKTVTGTVLEEGMKIMTEKGLRFSFVKITAKEKACPYDEGICTPDRCERAKGHYSRVNDAIYDLITHETNISAATIGHYAEKHCVCPYEFSLDVSLFTDVILCDYNYVFDPRVYFRRYFQGGAGAYLFLVDEAHNLADRAREMYSAVLVKEDVLAAKKSFKDDKIVVKRLDQLNRVMLELKRECDGETVFSSETFPSVLVHVAERCREAVSRYLERHRSAPDLEDRLTFYFTLYTFLETYDAMGEGYLPYASFDEENRFFVKLFAVNPAERIREKLEFARSSIFFSATLLPVNYYKSLLTGNPDENALYVDSPFDPANRKILVVRDVSSRYTRRTKEEFDRIAKCLFAFTQNKTGHYLAFFPSYRFLESVREKLIPFHDRVRILCQTQGMTEDERMAFLKAFTESDDAGQSLLGLTVSGGIFSEGIDLKGEALIGVAVIGTGLPLVSRERELMKRFFEDGGSNGFDYAYRFPGFNKVMQAAGRLIRTTDDRGVILLMDERFLYRENRMLFPREWASFETVRTDTITEPVKRFWESFEA